MSSSPGTVTKRSAYLEWEDYFMGVALLSAQRSKDPNTQVRPCAQIVDLLVAIFKTHNTATGRSLYCEP